MYTHTYICMCAHTCMFLLFAICLLLIEDKHGGIICLCLSALKFLKPNNINKYATHAHAHTYTHMYMDMHLYMDMHQKMLKEI